MSEEDCPFCVPDTPEEIARIAEVERDVKAAFPEVLSVTQEPHKFGEILVKMPYGRKLQINFIKFYWLEGEIYEKHKAGLIENLKKQIPKFRN